MVGLTDNNVTKAGSIPSRILHEWISSRCNREPHLSPCGVAGPLQRVRNGSVSYTVEMRGWESSGGGEGSGGEGWGPTALEVETLASYLLKANDSGLWEDWEFCMKT